MCNAVEGCSHWFGFTEAGTNLAALGLAITQNGNIAALGINNFPRQRRARAMV